MAEKIIVIGSNSFSGAHFVDHALQENARVVGVSRSAEPHPVFLPYKQRQAADFEFQQLDLNQDLERFISLFEKFSPDYVVNFAAQSMVGESWQHPEHWFQTNVVSTVKLHDALRRCKSLKKYVHISTPEVYGSCSGLIREHRNYQPSTPYAVSRAATDMSLMTYHQAYDFPVVFTRAANVYGPGQQLYRIIPRTILFFLTDRTLQLHGGGHSVRSFIHIADVVDGTMRAARQGVAGDIFHFSTPVNISIKALVEMIAGQLGVDFETRVEVVGERQGKDSAYLLDSSKARQELDWQDRISLEQGIEETIGWVKKNLDTLLKQPLDYQHKP